ncbi:MAG: hypothetical protein ACTSYL_12710 [Candidatus Thorarchaeota archaeon]
MIKSKVLLVILLLSVFISPVSAVTYPPATFTESDTSVTLRLSTADLIASPFDIDVHANITVEPVREDIAQINVTSITLMITKDNGDNNFGLLAADTVTFSHGQVGTKSVNITTDFALSGTGTGTRCFFALSVDGVFTNSTGNYTFRAVSSEDLVGPFNIAPGLSSPITQVGIVVIVISVICIAAGSYGVKKAKAPVPKKRGLLDE